jgi:hypothetical protein
MVATLNRVTLASMRAMTIDEIAALPVAMLSMLSEDIAAQRKQTAADADRLNVALNSRYERRAAERRKTEGKDFGVARIEDGEFIVICDLPKEVSWHQDKLADLAERIRASGEAPTEYMSIDYSVSETKYNALPANLRAAFEPARTVKPKKPSFKFEERGA